MSLESILDKGGFIVYILLGYSILGVAIALIKYYEFLKMGKTPKEDFSLENETFRGPEMAVVRSLKESHEKGVKDLDDVANRIKEKELDRLENGLKSIAFLANTAPLLGLLGTIIGMIQAFMVIEQNGGKVDSGVLAGGIWEAMLTTGVGLTVAIFLMLILHNLEGMVDKRDKAMFHFASLFFEKTNISHH